MPSPAVQQTAQSAHNRKTGSRMGKKTMRSSSRARSSSRFPMPCSASSWTTACPRPHLRQKMRMHYIRILPMTEWS